MQQCCCANCKVLAFVLRKKGTHASVRVVLVVTKKKSKVTAFIKAQKYYVARCVRAYNKNLLTRRILVGTCRKNA